MMAWRIRCHYGKTMQSGGTGGTRRTISSGTWPKCHSRLKLTDLGFVNEVLRARRLKNDLGKFRHSYGQFLSVGRKLEMDSRDILSVAKRRSTPHAAEVATAR